MFAAAIASLVLLAPHPAPAARPLLTAAQPAAAPAIAGPREVEPYRLVRLAAENLPPKAGLLWRVDPAAEVDRVAGLPKNRLEFVGPPGEYRVTLIWFVVGPDGEITADEVSDRFKISGATAPPPPPKDPKDPPPPAGSLYFLVVRPDGPASPEFTRVMGFDGWKSLAEKGHRVKDFTAAEARPWFAVPAGTQLPCVVTLRVGATASTVVRGPVPLPADNAGILKLTEGVGR